METKTKDCTELHQEPIQKQIPKWGPEVKDRKWGPVVERVIYDVPTFPEPKYKTEQKLYKNEPSIYSEEVLEEIKNNMPDDFNNLMRLDVKQECKYGNFPLLKCIFNKYEIGYLFDYLNMLFIISCEYGHLEMAKWLYSVHKNTDKKKLSESEEKLYESNKNVWRNSSRSFEEIREYVRSDCSLDINTAFVCACMNDQIEVTEWLLSIKPCIPDIKKLLLIHEKKDDYYSFFTSYYPEDLTYAEFMKSQHP
jgi:hypothetical protein